MNDKQAKRVKAMHDGAEQLIALAEGRIIEAQEALADADFALAMNRLGEARSKLQPLVEADNYMGGLQDTRIIRAKHLQEGMVMTGLGVVEELEIQADDHGHDKPCVNVVAKFSDYPQPQRYAGDQEVLIRVGESE